MNVRVCVLRRVCVLMCVCASLGCERGEGVFVSGRYGPRCTKTSFGVGPSLGGIPCVRPTCIFSLTQFKVFLSGNVTDLSGLFKTFEKSYELVKS